MRGGGVDVERKRKEKIGVAREGERGGPRGGQPVEDLPLEEKEEEGDTLKKWSGGKVKKVKVGGLMMEKRGFSRRNLLFDPSESK